MYTTGYKFSKGDSVQLLHTDKVGEIVAVRNGQAIVNFDYVILTLPLQEIKHIPLNNPSHLSKPSPSSFPTITAGINTLDLHNFLSFQPELDLHGLHVDDILGVLDKWIDQALLSGHRYLRIIHGKGKGLLRQQVHNYLKTHTSITKVIIDHNLPGGSGVTIVEL